MPLSSTMCIGKIEFATEAAEITEINS